MLTRCLQGLSFQFFLGNGCTVTLCVGQLPFNSHVYMNRTYKTNSSSQLIYCETPIYLSNSECDVLGRFYTQAMFVPFVHLSGWSLLDCC